ncbi:TPA: LysR family transcriptional regulator [Streptococcus suis]
MGMDVAQMKYLQAIVDSNYNLSLAARKIHISQSALSQFVTQFEQVEGIQLFTRKNGRLVSLTDTGETVFRYATEIVSLYQKMQEHIEKASRKNYPTIRFGVSSVYLRAYFSSFFVKFFKEYPGINVQISEGSSLELRERFLEHELEFVVLNEPVQLDKRYYDKQHIREDEYIAVVSLDHPLAKVGLLEWKDLLPYQIATLDQHFACYHAVVKKIKKERLDLTLSCLSSSWDFIIEMTKARGMVAILPRPIEDFVDEGFHKVIRFRDPLMFGISICRLKTSKNNQFESLVFDEFLKVYEHKSKDYME